MESLKTVMRFGIICSNPYNRSRLATKEVGLAPLRVVAEVDTSNLDQVRP